MGLFAGHVVKPSGRPPGWRRSSAWYRTSVSTPGHIPGMASTAGIRR